jgi:plasmid stabilization system protein ParE
MTYKLIVSDRAKQDRDRAFDWYLKNYSQEFAARWYEGISEAIEALSREPMRCHKAAENDRFPFTLYEKLYGRRMHKHRILFRVELDVVSILHIRHSSRRDLTVDDL